MQATPGFRGGLELELFWASTLVTQTELALGLLFFTWTPFPMIYAIYGHMYVCQVLITTQSFER